MLRAFALLVICAALSAAQGLRGTWSAAGAGGKTFSGTWTAEVHKETGAVTGLWTLRDPNGRILMGGGWSANKSPREWSGAWRATVAGVPVGYSGTWTATSALSPDSTLQAMLQAALQNVATGGWKHGAASGSWSIRAIP